MASTPTDDATAESLLNLIMGPPPLPPENRVVPYTHNTYQDGHQVLPSQEAVDKLITLLTYLGDPEWLPAPDPDKAIWSEYVELNITVTPYGWRTHYRSAESSSGYDEFGSGATLEEALVTMADGPQPDRPEELKMRAVRDAQHIDPVYLPGMILCDETRVRDVLHLSPDLSVAQRQKLQRVLALLVQAKMELDVK
jgi:hypothetical protein